MKRFRLPLLLLAAASLGACVHEFPESPNGDPMRDFSLQLQFSDELPVRKAPATKAEDAAEPRYTVQLYRYRSESELESQPAYTYSFTRKASSRLDTILYLPVAVDRYRVVGWVDWSGETPYYDISSPAGIRLASGYASGEHARDAFAFMTEYDVSGKKTAGETYSQTVQLKRPVAQLRFVVPSGAEFLAREGVDASQLSATLRYTGAIPDTYDLPADRVGGSRSGVTLTGKPQLDPSGELVILSDFVLSTDEGTSVPVELSVKTASGKELVSYTGEVPLLRTRATTIRLIQGGAFSKMKDSGSLSNGTQGVIVHEDHGVAMGAQNGNRREAVPVTVSKSKISDPGSSVQVFTLEDSGAGDWYLAVPDGYLATVGDGLVTIGEKADNARWRIVYLEKGTIFMAVSGENPVLGYDEDEGTFHSYGFTNLEYGLGFYIRNGGPVDKILQYQVPGCYVSGNNWSYVAGRNQYSCVYKGDDFSFVMMNPLANEQLVVTGMKDDIWIGDNVSVSVNWTRGGISKYADNLNLTVVQVRDNTVWMANEKTGEGLVIKK